MNDKHFTATGIILNNGKIFVLWHKKLNVWLPPGGHIEKNETPEEALIRECKEEINEEILIIKNKNNKLGTSDVAVINNPYCILVEPINDKNGFHHHVDFIYLCKLKDLSNIDKLDGKWVGLNDLSSLNTFENVKQLFFEVLTNIK